MAWSVLWWCGMKKLDRHSPSFPITLPPRAIAAVCGGQTLGAAMLKGAESGLAGCCVEPTDSKEFTDEWSTAV